MSTKKKEHQHEPGSWPVFITPNETTTLHLASPLQGEGGKKPEPTSPETEGSSHEQRNRR